MLLARRDPLARPEEAIRRLYSYVAYRIGPGPDAEDVVSETIERALRYRDSYDHRKGSSATWLAAIATRVLSDRRSRSGPNVVADPEYYREPLEDFSAASLQRLNLFDAMAAIDERSRDLLALRYGAELKAREIAELVGMKPNAVEVALSRALAQLRSIMDGADVGAPTDDALSRNAAVSS